MRYKNGSSKATKITFRCSEGFKEEVDVIAESENRSSANYIKGLILADMKKREEI